MEGFNKWAESATKKKEQQQRPTYLLEDDKQKAELERKARGNMDKVEEMRRKNRGF